MAKRIGELLVEKGLITRQQLFAALKAQLMLGGHLGTSLIELGYVTEDALGNQLSEIMGVPYAPREMFDNVPEWAIKSLTAAEVEKHRAVPIGRQSNSLHLAVMSPRDVASLSGVSGYKIVPWVAPETRIVEAMERYYNIPRTPRYICISQEISRGRIEGRVEAREAAQARSVDWMSLAAAPVSRMGPEPAERAEGKQPEADHAIDLSSGIGGPTDESLGMTGDSWRDIAKRYFEDDFASDEEEAEAAEQEEAEWTIPEVAMLMSHADDSDELYRVVMNYASAHFSASILFGVTSDIATVQACNSIALDDEVLQSLEFDVAENSIFDLLLGEEAYHGTVPRGAAYSRFYDTLKRVVPREIVLVPVYLSDRLVAILYGEGLKGESLKDKLPELRQLSRKLSLSLHMLILKKKIRAV